MVRYHREIASNCQLEHKVLSSKSRLVTFIESVLFYAFPANHQEISSTCIFPLRSCNLVYIGGRLDVLGEPDVLVHREEGDI